MNNNSCKSEKQDLKYVIGESKYDENSIVCSTKELKGLKCYEFYECYNEVAFVVKDLSIFKESFLRILNLIYYERGDNPFQIYNKFSAKNYYKSFINCMYVCHGIVFINMDDSKMFSNKSFNHSQFNNQDIILFCGNKAEESFYKGTSYRYKIKKPITNNRFKSIHPSPINNIQEDRMNNDWRFIKDTGNYESSHKNLIYNHNVKRSFFIKRCKCK